MKQKIDANMYNAVKTLLTAGSTATEIAQYLKISVATVRRIKVSETLEEYRHQMAAIQAEYQRRKTAKKAPEPISEPEPIAAPERAKKADPVAYNYVNNRMLEELKAQNELLKLISNKLAFIVEQLA